MAETIISTSVSSLDELSVLFADKIQSILGLDNDQVLISYSEKGQISSQINRDVVYIKVFQDQYEDNMYKVRKYTYSSKLDKVILTQTAMRMLLLQIVMYGPNSDRYSSIINEAFYLDSMNEFLYKNNLSLIPDKTDFMNRTYEKINERWWQRVDLKIRLYNSITIESSVDSIETAEVIAKADTKSHVIDFGGN